MKTILTNSTYWAGRILFILCAIGLFVFVPACSDYDDSELKGRVDKLEERVAELEENLTAQIESLQQMLDGKLTIAACQLDEETGIYTIVLSDGSTLEVAAAGESASAIGVMQQDGAYYWTLNGEPLLGADGKQLPVEVTPGIRVNPTTNEWEVSPDGGKNWLSTGIEATNSTSSIFTKVDEDDLYVYFTLSDGTSISIPKTQDFVCRPLSGKQYFKAGESKTINMEMSDVDKNIVVKPEGWKTVIANNQLTITAPASGNDAAETSGTVQIFAISSNGRCTICELAVEIGEAPHQISVDTNGNLTITVSESLTANRLWGGYYYGVTTEAEFSPEEIVKRPGQRPFKAPYQNTLAELLKASGKEYVKGETYVIYAVDTFIDEDTMTAVTKAEDMLYEMHTAFNIDISFSSVTFEDANLKIKMQGGTARTNVRVQKLSDSSTADKVISEFLGNLNDPDYSFFATEQLSSDYDGSFASFAKSKSSLTPAPGQKYLLMLAVDGASNYTAEDIFSSEIELAAISKGGSAAVTVSDVDRQLTKISALITPDETTGTYKYYTKYYTGEEKKNLTEDAMFDDLLATGTEKTAPATYSFSRSGLTASTEGWLCIVALDKTGKAGTIQAVDVSTTKIEYNDMTVEAKIADGDIDFTSVKIALSASGEVEKYRYVCLTESAWSAGFPWQGKQGTEKTKEIMAAVSNNAVKTVAVSDLDGGKLEITGLTFYTEYRFFLMGVDKDNKLTEMGELKFTAGKTVETLYTATEPTNAPEITDILVGENKTGPWTSLKTMNEIPSKNGYFKVALSVKDKASFKQCWVFDYHNEFVLNTAGSKKTIEVIKRAYTDKTCYTDPDGDIVTGYGNYAPDGTATPIFFVWQDADNKVYQCRQLDPASFLAGATPEP